MSNIYVLLGQSLYKVEDGIAKRQRYMQGYIKALRRRSYIVYAMPIKRKQYIEGFKIYKEKKGYIYYYILKSGQKVLIGERDMQKLFREGRLTAEHRELMSKDIFIVEEII